MKKLFSVFLAALMLMSLAAPAALAASQDIPIIRINGTGRRLFDKNGQTIYSDTGNTILDGINEKAKPLLEKFAHGIITGGDYEAWSKELYDILYPVYGVIALDNNGEASDGSNCDWNYETVAVNTKKSGYGLNDYCFEYDWRLSPMDTAEQLKVYIDRVKAATGHSKVSIRSRCYGSNVTSAYLAAYPEHAASSISRIIYYVPSTTGVDFIGALFSGKISITDDAVDNFVNYYLENNDIIEDPVIKTFITTLVTLLNEIKLLGITGDALTTLVRNVSEYAVPMIVRDMFSTWPSYWSMVGKEYYEDAKKFIFDGYEDEYAGLIEKCDNYYNNVTNNFDSLCDAADAAGIETYVVAKYNSPLFPLTENATAQGDGYTTIDKQTFGATAADYNKVLSNSYIEKLETTDYLSPDHKIDASTARYKDTTWFIKNVYHSSFPNAEDALFTTILKDGINVFSTEAYPQYMDYDETNGTYVAVTGLDEIPEKDKKGGILAILMKWLTSLISIINRLFNSNFDLGGVLGTDA